MNRIVGTMLWKRSLRADGGVNDRSRVMLRPEPSQSLLGPRVRQKGLTTTSTTMIATATPGTSFMSRSAVPLLGRAPRASDLP